MKRTARNLTLLFMLSGSVFTSAAAANAAFGVAQLAAASKSAAAAQARAEYGGKVLSVEEVSQGGRTVFRVKLLLAGGRIKIVTVSANNG